MSPSCLYVQMSSEFAGTSCAKDAYTITRLKFSTDSILANRGRIIHSDTSLQIPLACGYL